MDGVSLWGCASTVEVACKVTAKLRPRLSALLVSRLERLYALCPENNKCSFVTGSAADEFEARTCGAKLSPNSQSRVQSIQKQPTKAIITEQEKVLLSAEQSVQKALQLLNKTAADCEAQKEKEEARLERADEIRQKRTEEMEKIKSRAREEGRQEANHEDCGRCCSNRFCQ